MKKAALLTLFAVLALSVALRTHVQANGKPVPVATPRLDDDDGSACSNSTLEGVYGLAISGTRPVPGAPPGTFEQVIGVGTRTFDGAGNFTQITNEKGSVSGLPLPDRFLQGTYSVNPDCSGTLTLVIPGLSFSVVYDLVVVHHGRAFDSIVASPAPVMVTASGRRVN